MVLTGCIIRSGFKIARVSCRRLRAIGKQKQGESSSVYHGLALSTCYQRPSSCLLSKSHSRNDHSRGTVSLNSKKHFPINSAKTENFLFLAPRAEDVTRVNKRYFRFRSQFSRDPVPWHVTPSRSSFCITDLAAKILIIRSIFQNAPYFSNRIKKAKNLERAFL